MSRGCGCDGECGVPPTRSPIWNPAGADRIAYRIGTFPTFRRTLLNQLPGERELVNWQPSAGDDLGLLLVDAWAYIADILTFYNERYAGEHYLRTAVRPERVGALVALLGYRPRPAIAATGRLAVIAAGPGPLAVPRGLAIASKGTPGIASQTFEVDEEARFERPTSVLAPVTGLQDSPPLAGPPASAPPGTVEVPAQPRLVARGGVLLKGNQTLPTGERLLLMTRTWSSANSPAVVVHVLGTVVEVDAHGRKNTRVLLEGTMGLPSNAASPDYRLLRASRTGHLSTLPVGAAAVASTSLVLDAPARYLAAGDPLLVELPGAGVGGSPGTNFDVLRLTAYAEVLWYANALPASPTVPPTGETPGIPLQVAALAVRSHSGGTGLTARYGGSRTAKVVVHSGWHEVGTLLDTPVSSISTMPSSVTLAAPPAAVPGVALSAVIEDATGVGAEVTAVPVAGTSTVSLTGGTATLQPPLRLLWDLIEVSRGVTVRGEDVGRGDGAAPGQDFTLAKSPVTFRTDFPGRSGDGYSSTIELVVDGRRWTEVPSLYGRRPRDEVFATWNDGEGHTHVRTGDGIAGRRLATGAPVTATYRVGAGAAVPPPGALTTLLSTPPNLRSVRNPVAPAGGADAQPASEIRELAPRSVLTFGRAISGDDYAAVAAAAPGVARAEAVWAFDATEQRPSVSVYVGDDAAAVESARAALRTQADPNRPLHVLPAVKVTAALEVVLAIEARYVIGPVVDEARQAVLDELFAPGALALGEPLYRSELERVLTDVPGVLASRQLRFHWQRGGIHISAGPRFDPGNGGFFDVAPERVLITGEVAS